MQFQRLFALIAATTVVVCGCSKPEAPPTDRVVNLSEPLEAQPRLATVQLWLGPEQMTAEMAASIKEVSTGMMFRTNMEENEGMIFTLGLPQRAHFWMKNCYLPLSVAYIDPEGVILEIHDLQPQDRKSTR